MNQTSGVKIKSIHIKGLRGVRHSLDLKPDQKSILMYGDNACGKSSITDVFEWFYYDRVEHLSVKEIEGKGGRSALRNYNLRDDEEALFKVQYSEKELDCEKKIKQALEEESSNDSEQYSKYCEVSQKENLILRHRDLTSFVLATKSERLTDLSDIIGFEQVSNIRKTLQSVANSLKNEIRRGNYDNRIQDEQKELIQLLGGNITSIEQLFKKFQDLLAPFGIPEGSIKSYGDVDQALKEIQNPQDQKLLHAINSAKELRDAISEQKKADGEINSEYDQYYEQYNKLLSDIEKTKQLLLDDLLKSGKSILESKSYTDSRCPLCLQSKDTAELLEEIKDRLSEIQSIQQEKEKFDQKKSSIQDKIDHAVHEINSRSSKLNSFSEQAKKVIEKNLVLIREGLDNYAQELKKKILAGDQIKKKEELKIDPELYDEIIQTCEKEEKHLKQKSEQERSGKVSVDIGLSKNAYQEIEELKQKRERLTSQYNAFELIHKKFLEAQKKGIQSFLNNFSQQINEYFKYLIPDKRIKKIQIKEVEKEDELTGLTLEFDFFGSMISPPQKYFSESYLNAFGIAFFLASVKAFNRENKFFILDDIISSFDADHRKRFSDLLIDKFSDYQIITLTHEKDWFQLHRKLTRKKGWLTQEIKWDTQQGTYIDGPPS